VGFKQTDTHRNGKGSYHQIGLVRGQFGNMPYEPWVKFVQDAGFDGWEEASWELDLRQCDTDAGAAAYARQRVDLAKRHGLEIFTVATHLQGQCLGDEPSAKSLNFLAPNTDARKAYKAWRDAGNKPPRTDPYYVPGDVGKLIHDQSQKDLMACVRFAGHEVRVGPRRLVAGVAPGLVRLPGVRVWGEKVERLGRRLVAEVLALEVGGDGEDFQAVLLGEIHPLLRVGGGPAVGVALAQVEFPGGLFPAVEAGVLHELDPRVLRHGAELPADETDLVVIPLAVAVGGGLLESHRRVLARCLADGFE
jgi:hypothetical protein